MYINEEGRAIRDKKVFDSYEKLVETQHKDLNVPEDQATQEQLISSCYKLLKKLVHKFGYNGMPLDELYSIGIETLVRCANKFDPSKKTKFSTFFYTSIRNAYASYVKNSKRISYYHIQKGGMSLDETHKVDEQGHKLTLSDIICDPNSVDETVIDNWIRDLVDSYRSGEELSESKIKVVNRRKRVVKLFMEGYTYFEICDVETEDQGVIGNDIYKIRQWIKAKVKKDYPDIGTLKRKINRKKANK